MRVIQKEFRQHCAVRLLYRYTRAQPKPAHTRQGDQEPAADPDHTVYTIGHRTESQSQPRTSPHLTSLHFTSLHFRYSSPQPRPPALPSTRLPVGHRPEPPSTADYVRDAAVQSRSRHRPLTVDQPRLHLQKHCRMSKDRSSGWQKGQNRGQS